MRFPFTERKHEDELFKDVFQGERGQELIAHLSNTFHVFKTAQTPDPYVSAFQEGQRSVVIKIMEMLHQDLDSVKRKLDNMEQERLKRRQ